MKKIIVLLFIGLSSLSLFSQSKYSGGIEGGLAYSWFNPDNKKAENLSGRLAFTYGVFMDKKLSNTFSFSLGIFMLDAGGKLKYDHNIIVNTVEKRDTLKTFGDLTHRIKYIEIPFSIKGKTQEIGYITYFAKAGLNPMVPIKSRIDLNGANFSDTDKDLNNLGEINLFGIGFHLGAGLEYSLGGSTAFIVELLYSNNYLGIIRGNANDVKIASNFIQLKTGIKF